MMYSSKKFRNFCARPGYTSAALHNAVPTLSSGAQDEEGSTKGTEKKDVKQRKEVIDKENLLIQILVLNPTVRSLARVGHSSRFRDVLGFTHKEGNSLNLYLVF